MSTGGLAQMTVNWNSRGITGFFGMALLSMVLAGLMSVVPAYGQTQSGASDESAEAATADHSDSGETK